MAVLNYLQLVNKVLVKLREDEVETVDQNSYSRLIGTFVNDAKDEVEAAWAWASLRQTINVTGVIGQRNYGLSISTSAALIRDPQDPNRPMAFTVTPTLPDQRQQLIQLPLDYVIREQILSNFDLASPAPIHFGLEGVNGEWTAQFTEAPTEDVSWRFFFKVAQDELDEDGDGMIVPWRPVVALATMYALNERGEEIGEPGNIAEQRYRNTLSAAISFEALENPHQLVATPE